MIQDTIEREITIDAPPERVWSVLTEPEHLGTWFGDAGAEIDLRPGGAMRLSWKEYGTVSARVEHVDPPRAFSYRWADRRGEEVSDAHSTLVEFTLTPAGDGTRLRVVESGFAALARSGEERAQKFADNTEGWLVELDQLRSYAERAGVR